MLTKDMFHVDCFTGAEQRPIKNGMGDEGT
jgi:hypothetical protein